MYEPYKKIGILITHGTDTMAWTFHFLRYALKNLPCNVVLTGSQIPLEWLFGGSDAPKNIENSIRLLTYVRGPSVFMVFNNGKIGFDDDIRKTHMWDENAFEGNVSFQFMIDYIKHLSGSYELTKSRKLDMLLHISTGGTIESEKSSSGYLHPKEKPDLVHSYLNKFVGIFYNNLVSVGIKKAKDSSNITPEDWEELCEIIEGKMKASNYTTYSDLKFNYNVTILSPSPLLKTNDYITLMEPYEGIVISGYGGGNINILENSEYSLLEAIDWAIRQGKFVVLGSQVNRGISEPLYETGWKAIEHKAIPSGDFGIPKSQIKLSYILGHMEEINKVANENNIDKWKLVALAFLSGVNFRSLHTKRKIEAFLGFKIPEKDPFFNTSFKNALNDLLKYIKVEKKGLIRFKNTSEFVTWAKKNMRNLKNHAIILKPDSVVGFNRWGEGIDGAQNLEYIINSAFDWNAITINLIKTNYMEMRRYVTEKIGKSVGEFLRGAKYIFIESGRAPTHGMQSFDNRITKEDFMNLIKEILLNRTINSAPAIYLGLGQQVFLETLNSVIIDFIDKEDKGVNELMNIDTQAARKLLNTFHIIDEVGNRIIIHSIDGKTVAKGYHDKKFIASEILTNNQGLKMLVPYVPSETINKELLESYYITAKLGSGIVEDLVNVDKIDVAVLYSKRINEEAVLFLNFALRKLHEFVKQYRRSLEKTNKLKDILFHLPIGLEILCSIHYQASKKQMANVAGLAIYYYDYTEEILLRDFSYLFHPEILSDMRSFENVYNKPLSIRDDGLKILITTIYSSFAKNWVRI